MVGCSICSQPFCYFIGNTDAIIKIKNQKLRYVSIKNRTFVVVLKKHLSKPDTK
jgi:hypothetical protein